MRVGLVQSGEGLKRPPPKADVPQREEVLQQMDFGPELRQWLFLHPACSLRDHVNESLTVNTLSTHTSCLFSSGELTHMNPQVVLSITPHPRQRQEGAVRDPGSAQPGSTPWHHFRQRQGSPCGVQSTPMLPPGKQCPGDLQGTTRDSRASCIEKNIYSFCFEVISDVQEVAKTVQRAPV